MLNPESIKILDPACGSGHILVEAYDLLKAIYLERGYPLRSIPRLILEKNLYGLDIDDRAAQLAGFALLMKARADDRRLLDNPPQLNVLALQASNNLNVPLLWQQLDLNSQSQLGTTRSLFANPQTDLTQTIDDSQYQLINNTLALFAQAQTLGSLIQIPVGQLEPLHDLLAQCQTLARLGDSFQKTAATTLLPFIRQAIILAMQFDAVVANPPYMGGKGMNPALKEFAKRTFPDSKSDLFAMFMERFLGVRDEGLGVSEKQDLPRPSPLNPTPFVAMVTMQSWMFLSSFQAMREKLLGNKTLNTMAHLGARAFSEISGEVVQTTAFVFHGDYFTGYKPAFFRLVDGNEEQKQTDLRIGQNRFDSTVQEDFKKIPGSPVAYWVSDIFRNVYENSVFLSQIAHSLQGIITGENNKFLRVWHEVCVQKLALNKNDISETDKDSQFWIPYNKGGDLRKWYGNNEFVLNWSNEGRDLTRARTQNVKYYLKPCVTWTFISSSFFAARYCPQGFLWDVAGSSAFPSSEQNFSIILGLMCSKVGKEILNASNPTVNFQVENILALPIHNEIYATSKNIIEITDNLIEIAKTDWNNYETSWHFTENPLIRQKQNFVGWVSDTACALEGITQQTKAPNVGLRDKAAFMPLRVNPTYASNSLEHCFNQWQTQNRNAIAEMKRLEEENNRLFIEAYGLQDELSPDVPEEQITLTRADREKDCQRLISYAIGCMMGRYRLDRPGLIYAHAGNVDFDKIYNGGDRDEGRGASEMLPRPDCLAESNGVGRACVSNDQSISERGTLWIKQPDSTGGSVDTFQHRGGTCATEPRRIPEFSVHCTGFESGSGDSNADSSASRLGKYSADQGNNVSAGGTIENAQCTEIQTKPSSLNPNPFCPDADGIVPITDELWFEDDAANRLNEFLQVAFLGARDEGLGELATSTEPSPLNPHPSNLQWLAASLGQKPNETAQETLRRYLASHFYKNHLQTYKKRPIYWLFSSGKQGAFQALVYLHRYQESTLARMRAEYVVPLTGKIGARIDMLEKDAAAAVSNATRSKLNKDIEKLKKKHVELLAYDEKLRHYADLRIPLDLDDGVKVNYAKFGDLLAEVKAVTGGSGDD